MRPNLSVPIGPKTQSSHASFHWKCPPKNSDKTAQSESSLQIGLRPKYSSECSEWRDMRWLAIQMVSFAEYCAKETYHLNGEPPHISPFRTFRSIHWMARYALARHSDENFGLSPKVHLRPKLARHSDENRKFWSQSKSPSELRAKIFIWMASQFWSNFGLSPKVLNGEICGGWMANLHIYIYIFFWVSTSAPHLSSLPWSEMARYAVAKWRMWMARYAVATVIRIDNLIGLFCTIFCKRDL